MTSTNDNLDDELSSGPDPEIANQYTSVNTFLRPFRSLLDDDSITEIAVNGRGTVWYEKNAEWSCAATRTDSQAIIELGQATATASGQKWDQTVPLLSAALPDGVRIQLVRPPAVENGFVSFTLRKPAKVAYTLGDFEKSGLFGRVEPVVESVRHHELELINLIERKSYRQFFERAVKERLNIVVSGSTGSGKTTFMKALAREIPLHERIVTIEDVRELQLPHRNKVHLLYSKGGQGGTKTGPKELLESCLRMKPDRILLAEVRGDECLYFVRNAASGHPGSMTSCHAGSTALAFEQMAIMIQDSPGGKNLTFDVIKRLLTLTIDVIVQFQNHEGRRFISEIYYDPKSKLDLA